MDGGEANCEPDDRRASYILGTAADRWGRTWTDPNFSNASFRVRVTEIAGNANREFRLDWLAVRVTYIP